MPADLLENNLQRLTAVQKPKTGPPSAIFSFNNHTEAQLALKQLQKGPSTKRVTVTHDGGYGIDGVVPEELTDNAISHTIFTFGWPMGNNTVHFKPDFLTAIHTRKARWSVDCGGRFALIGNGNYQYCCVIGGLPNSPNQLNTYFTDQQNFYTTLGPGLTEQFIHRPAQFTFGHQQERWFENGVHPEISVRLHDGRGFNCLSFELVVMDYIGTTLTIRSLANLPFLVYCRPEWWPIDPAAAETIARLKQVGVWHDTPTSAANFLKKISGDIRVWWTAKETATAISSFRRNYCGSDSPSLPAAVGAFLSTF